MFYRIMLKLSKKWISVGNILANSEEVSPSETPKQLFPKNNQQIGLKLEWYTF